MKEQGIMFSAPMVRAVDCDRKTQTRRLASSPLAKLRPGTMLWVREAWRTMAMFDTFKPVKLREKYEASAFTPAAMPVLYEADEHRRGQWPDDEPAVEAWGPGKLRPSIHMPRFASRIGLRLEDVRIEPLQRISHDDAIAEGIEREDGGWKSYETYPDGSAHPHAVVPNRSPRTSYRELWSSLHGATSWEANPDVVVLIFSKAWIDR